MKGTKDEGLEKVILTLFFFPWSRKERNGNLVENVTCVIDALNNI